MEMKKIILTGPTGSVGISLIEEMVKNKIFVTAICREHSTGIRDIPKSEYVNIVECNLDNLKSLIGQLPDDYDAFYHFGWDGTYGNTRMDLRLQTNNVLYSLDAVELAKNLGCKVFVGSGSKSEF